MRIEADINNGITEVKEFDLDTKVVDQDTFFALLDIPSIFEDSVLGTEIDGEMKTEIESLYGKIK